MSPGNDGPAKYDRVLASTATSPRPLGRDDPRLSVPLFTLRESATYLHTPVSTLHAWAHPKDAAPLVTMFPRAGRRATVPFVGFAEAYVLGALRGAGVPMQRIRPAVAKLSAEIGLEHALASQRVYTDGAELIFDYATQSEDEALLTVVRTGQQHFAQIIRDYLKRITYGDDGWAERLRLPAYTKAEVSVDPRQAFGQPIVVHGGARVEDLVDRFQAGDGFTEIANDFGVPAEEVEDVIRVALRLAA
ncbi:MAG TPA: DUF433 domain-containing protein [Solirubrobacteraceae bacterium]